MLAAVVGGAVMASLAGCGGSAPAASPSGQPSISVAPSTSTATASLTAPSSTTSSATSGAIAPTPYTTVLAKAARQRGFQLEPIAGGVPRITAAAAIRRAAEFRSPGEVSAIHLARVYSPTFRVPVVGDVHAKLKFPHSLTWLVIYTGTVGGQRSTFVVFVDATHGDVAAVVGFGGANLNGGAPCPNGRCITE
jgi:hypothetical protein